MTLDRIMCSLGKHKRARTEVVVRDSWHLGRGGPLKAYPVHTHIHCDLCGRDLGTVDEFGVPVERAVWPTGELTQGRQGYRTACL